jgi:hypothetical protein
MRRTGAAWRCSSSSSSRIPGEDAGNGEAGYVEENGRGADDLLSWKWKDLLFAGPSSAPLEPPRRRYRVGLVFSCQNDRHFI